tara:strand:- start:1898 stop:2272 length:375 start_codon:yes stop_codon:yes gene_type:complete
MKVNKYYLYHQSYSGLDTFSFGWKESDKFSISEQDCVISIDSGPSKEISVAKRDDYHRYFISLTGFSPKEFVKIWGEELDLLESHQKDINSNYSKGEGEFLISLAKLLSLGKPFAFKNIKYKII